MLWKPNSISRLAEAKPACRRISLLSTQVAALEYLLVVREKVGSSSNEDEWATAAGSLTWEGLSGALEWGRHPGRQLQGRGGGRGEAQGTQAERPARAIHGQGCGPH